jgi:hypothetical protein
MVSSLKEAESTSRSPSPSTSAVSMYSTPSAPVVMVRVVHPGGEAPSFSSQATLSSKADAETTSRSPSASTSARER